MIKGIIYDCDGTITDSRAALMAFYGATLAGLGIPFPADDPGTWAYCTAHGVRDVAARYAEGPAMQRRFLSSLAAADHASFTQAVRLEHHVLETMARLRRAYRLAIATNRGNDMALLAERFRLTDYVDLIVTAADVAHAKPHPAMFLAAASGLGLEPAEMVVVGDSSADAEGAAAAGMTFLAYAPPRSDEPPAGERAPWAHLARDHVLTDHRDLPRVLALLQDGRRLSRT